MELILQKCVELGVSRVVPVITAHTVSHPANAGMKALRWQKVAKAAAQQSGRDIIPHMHKIVSFKDALGMITNQDASFIANEQENDAMASAVFQKTGARNVGLFVGPEGGLEPAEISELLAAGCVSVSLGKRVLRVETAAIAVMVVFMSARGEL
jgi:16S rRNA (uracil1498-N3)-methyltransferase